MFAFGRSNSTQRTLSTGLLRRLGTMKISKRTFHALSRGSAEQEKENPSSMSDGYLLQHTHKEGQVIPALGFGTWGCNHFDNDTMAQSVDIALRVGYRHLDCARVYENEKEIGAVLRDHIDNGRLTRDQVWLTSKLYNHEHAPPAVHVELAIQDTLKALDTDYLDCFLIHWHFSNRSAV